jgi:hypothetical protein
MHLRFGVLYQDNKLRASTLQNIVTTAIKLKALDFVYDFLMQHKDLISGTFQPKQVWDYNYALYHFEKKEFSTASALLPNYLDLEDTFYVLAARRLEIKILFETENNAKYDTLSYKLDAFKNYLFEGKKNQKISEILFEANNNFVDLLKQIRGTIAKDQDRIEKLVQKLEGKTIYAEREWFSEKLTMLS